MRRLALLLCAIGCHEWLRACVLTLLGPRQVRTCLRCGRVDCRGRTRWYRSGSLFCLVLALAGPARAGDLACHGLTEAEEARAAVVAQKLPARLLPAVRVVGLTPEQWKVTRGLGWAIDGLYVEKDRTVYVPTGSRWDDQNLLHELAHAAYWQLSDADRRAWRGFWSDNQGRMPIRFARANEREGWAWSVQYLLAGRVVDAEVAARVRRLLGD